MTKLQYADPLQVQVAVKPPGVVSTAHCANRPRFIFPSCSKRNSFKSLDYCAQAWRQLTPVSHCTCAAFLVGHQMLPKYASFDAGSTATMQRLVSRVIDTLTGRETVAFLFHNHRGTRLRLRTRLLSTTRKMSILSCSQSIL